MLSSLRSPLLRSPATRCMSSYVKSEESFNEVLDWFKQHRATAVLRTPTSSACPKAMSAAIEGGFKICEFTLTTPDALLHMSDFKKEKKYDGQVKFGMGTVMNTRDCEMAVDAGAEFIISPIMIPEVITWCASNKIPCLPGCHTPTEAYNAYLLGAPVQKIFPGVAGNHMWMKAVSAALPMLRLNPTSGVGLENAGDFLDNGCVGVGLVAPLFDPVMVQEENWEGIKANAEVVMKGVKACGPYIEK
ncbi:hypothetical protein TrLO_g5420 [Triparma laevis f. longispina]|uniref:Uncharacterized protein n=2 Tax=Triparma laevis TaxID=1534972 RepID=A0A9W7KWD5_9STRA|nr:hypothetical protein TrLO_g5420 [Triparma laevis f. longispina]